jgi:hypothetical protein
VLEQSGGKALTAEGAEERQKQNQNQRQNQNNNKDC